MAADPSQFKRIAVIAESEAITLCYPYLEFVCAFKLFESKRGMPRVVYEKSKLFVRP